MKHQPRKTTKLDVFLICLSLLVILGFMVFYVMYASHQASAPAPVTQAQQTPLNADKIFDLVNQERIKAGVPPLVRDARLDATAQSRADDMVARNYFSHYDPVTGENLSGILLQFRGTLCVNASENISYHWKTNEEVVAGWMGSKAHHDALLDNRYTFSGMSVANNDAVVQHFCQTQ